MPKALGTLKAVKNCGWHPWNSHKGHNYDFASGIVLVKQHCNTLYVSCWAIDSRRWIPLLVKDIWPRNWRLAFFQRGCHGSTWQIIILQWCVLLPAFITSGSYTKAETRFLSVDQVPISLTAVGRSVLCPWIPWQEALKNSDRQFWTWISKRNRGRARQKAVITPSCQRSIVRARWNCAQHNFIVSVQIICYVRVRVWVRQMPWKMAKSRYGQWRGRINT